MNKQANWHSGSFLLNLHTLKIDWFNHITETSPHWRDRKFFMELIILSRIDKELMTRISACEMSRINAILSAYTDTEAVCNFS